MEAPPNICTPTHLANAAAKIAEGASDVMQLQILEKEDCEKLNMGCYLAVAACSAEPLKFIHLTYKPKGEFLVFASSHNHSFLHMLGCSGRRVGVPCNCFLFRKMV